VDKNLFYDFSKIVSKLFCIHILEISCFFGRNFEREKDMKYEIIRDYIRIGNSRSGQKISKVSFIVSHSTGNPGSTAYGNRHYFDTQQPPASAHTFIDDRYILEIIPLDEKAWHVRYNSPADNQLYGKDANDAAIGVELCYGGKINFKEAYDRYVWYHAYLCDKFGLNPLEHIISHMKLDPKRRTDPINALRPEGISWSAFLEDVKEAYDEYFKSKTIKRDQPKTKGSTVTLPVGKGDRGQFVKEIQEDLIAAGFELPRYGADGTFGDETENAVMRFQKRYGLKVDGLVGPQTLTKLQQVVTHRKYADDFPLPDGIWKKGDTGEEVKMIQRALKHLNFDPKSIDGIYGELTEDAVRRFQSKYAALKDDGIYGPNTRRYMRMELNDK
jgi:N-acetylmuramoyl-L-alanine amidase